VTPVAEAFVHLANRYSAARRRKDRVEVQGGDLNAAIAGMQEVEQEASECFILARTPDGMRLRR